MTRPGTTGGPRPTEPTPAAATEGVVAPRAGDQHASPAEAANPVVEAELATAAETPQDEGAGTRRFSLGLDRFSGLYVWAALIIVFAIWVPDTFLRTQNIQIIAGN